MIINENKSISITQLDSSEQKRLIHLVARLDESSRVDVFDNHKTIFHKLKSKYIDIENKTLSYCSFILSVKEFESSINIDKLRSIKFENQYKKVDVNEKLTTVLSVILELRDNQKYTFRSISKYLKKYYKIDVVHSTIYKFYKKNEKETKC